MITLNNITKSFYGTEVLKGISMAFEHGKTKLIIGQSGSGKKEMRKRLWGGHQQDKRQLHCNDEDFEERGG